MYVYVLRITLLSVLTVVLSACGLEHLFEKTPDSIADYEPVYKTLNDSGIEVKNVDCKGAKSVGIFYESTGNHNTPRTTPLDDPSLVRECEGGEGEGTQSVAGQWVLPIQNGIYNQDFEITICGRGDLLTGEEWPSLEFCQKKTLLYRHPGAVPDMTYNITDATIINGNTVSKVTTPTVFGACVGAGGEPYTGPVHICIKEEGSGSQCAATYKDNPADYGVTVTCSNDNYQYQIPGGSQLVQGKYDIAVIAVNDANNETQKVGTLGFNHIVDTTAPPMPVLDSIPSYTNNNNFLVSWNQVNDLPASFGSLDQNAAYSVEVFRNDTNCLGSPTPINVLDVSNPSAPVTVADQEELKFRVTARDHAGNTTTTACSSVLTGDLRAPEITGPGHNPGSPSNTQPSITFACNDQAPGSGVLATGGIKICAKAGAACSAQDGPDYNITADCVGGFMNFGGNPGYTLNLSPGQYDVKAIAIDAAGNKSAPTSIVSNYIFDNQSPNVPAFNFNSVQFLTAPSFDFTWTSVIDVGLAGLRANNPYSLRIYEDTCGGTEVTGSPIVTDQLTYNFNSSNGITQGKRYVAQVTVYDAVGNTSQSLCSPQVVYDDGDPTLTNLEVQDLAGTLLSAPIKTGTGFQVAGSCNDGSGFNPSAISVGYTTGSCDSYDFSALNLTTNCTANSFSRSIPGIAVDNTYNVCVRAEDVAGNSSVATAGQVHVDGQAPATPNFTAPNGSPLDAPLVAGGTEFDFKWDLVSDLGVAGMRDTDTYVVELYTTTDTNLASCNGSVTNINISQTDPTYVSGGTVTYKATGLNHLSVYSVKVTAYDNAGNSSSACSKRVQIDNGLPSVNSLVFNPASPSNTSGNITISGTCMVTGIQTIPSDGIKICIKKDGASCTYPGEYTVTTSCDGNHQSPNQGTFSYQFDLADDGSDDGDYLIEVVADNGSASAPASDRFVYDHTAPNDVNFGGQADSFQSPNSGGTDLLFTWTGGADSGSGLHLLNPYQLQFYSSNDASDKCQAGTEVGGTVDASSASYTYNTAVVSGQSYSVAVRARDQAGNLSTNAVCSPTITYDSTAPGIDLTLLTSSPSNSTSLDISGTCVENNNGSGLQNDQVRVCIRSGAGSCPESLGLYTTNVSCSQALGYSHTISGLANDTYEVRTVAVDNEGNARYSVARAHKVINMNITGTLQIGTGNPAPTYTNQQLETLLLTTNATESPVEMVIGGSSLNCNTINWNTQGVAFASTVNNHDLNTHNPVGVCIRDNAGNVSSLITDDIIFDNTAPTGTPVVPSAPFNDPAGIVTVSFTSLSETPTEFVISDTFVDCGTSTNWLPYTSQHNHPAVLGTNQVYVKFKDAAGNIGACTASNSYIFDQSAPSLFDLDPADTSLLGAASQLLTGKCTEDGTISVSSSDLVTSPVAGNCTGGTIAGMALTFKAPPILPDGARTINVEITDAAGNSSDVDLTYTLSTQPPVLTFTVDGHDKDASPRWVTDGQVNLSLSASSGYSPYQVIYKNSLTSAGDCSGAYSAMGGSTLNVSNHSVIAPTTDGVKYVSARLLDSAGNESDCVTVAVDLDSQAPNNINLTPVLTVSNSNTVDFDISALDSGVNPSGLSQILMSNSSTCSSGSWEAYPSDNTRENWTLPASDGTYTAYVNVRDVAGNESGCTAATSTVQVDTASPSLSNINPTPNSLIGNSAVTITGRCTEYASITIDDPNSVLAAPVNPVTCSQNGANFEFSVSVVYSSDGTKTIDILAQDEAGNQSSTSVAYTISTAAPDGLISINSDASHTQSSTVSINLVPSGGVGPYEYYLSTTDTSCASPVWQSVSGNNPIGSYPLSGADGTKTVYYQFRDSASNTSACKSQSIILDTQNPSALAIAGPSDTNTATVALTGINASDNLSAQNALQMYITNDSACATGGSWEAFATTKAAHALDVSGGDGAKTVYFKVRDESGRESGCLASNLINLDTGAPTIHGDPINVTNFYSNATQNWVGISIYCSEAGSVTVGGTGIRTNPATVTCAGPGTMVVNFDSFDVESSFGVTLKLTDAAGNESSLWPFTYHHDATPPAPDIDTPTPGNVIGLNSTVSGSCETGGGDVTIVGADVSSSDTVACTAGSYSANVVFFDKPTIKARARQTDLAGNEGYSNEETWSVDNSYPVVILDDIPGWVRQNVTVTGECTGGDGDVSILDGAAAASGPCTYNGAAGRFEFSVAVTLPHDNDVPDGNMTIRARQTDSAGNVTTTNPKQLQKDTVPPTIGCITQDPAVNNGWYNVSTVLGANLKSTCSDTSNGTSSGCDLTSAVCSIGSSSSCTGEAAWGQGLNVAYSVSMTDQAGNSASSSGCSLKIDQTAPTVTWNDPSSAPVPGLHEEWDFAWTPGDALSGPEMGAYERRKITNGTAEPTFTATPDAFYNDWVWGANEGAYSLEVRVWDKAGNYVASESPSVIYDSTPPVFDPNPFINLSDNATTPLRNYSVFFKAASDGEFGSGLKNVDPYHIDVYEFDPVAGSSWGGACTGSFPTPFASSDQVDTKYVIQNMNRNRQYVVKIYATDEANLPSTHQCSSVLTVGESTINITKGVDHTCAATGNGLYCWGSGGNGRLGNGASSGTEFLPIVISPFGVNSGITKVAAGSKHTCATVNNQLKCWGDNTSYQLSGNGGNVLSASSAVSVAFSGAQGNVQDFDVGDFFTCAIQNSNLYCWGNHGDGQIGKGSPYTVDQINPYKVDFSANAGVQYPRVLKVSTGVATTCAIIEGGALYCWGKNVSGQVGIGNTTSKIGIPTQVTGLGSNVTDVAVGRHHTCAIHEDVMKCWGKNSDGQLGDPGFTTNQSTLPRIVAIDPGVTGMAVGDFHTCAIVRGQAKCFGKNNNDQLANSSAGTESTTPITVTDVSGAPMVGVTALSAREDTTCAIRGGTPLCWGQNSSGELGIGTNGGTYAIAQKVAPYSSFTADTSHLSSTDGTWSGVGNIAAGGSHSCAVVKGSVKCWGSNQFGQVNNSIISDRSESSTANSLHITGGGSKKFLHVAAGKEHSCAVIDGGKVACWGDSGDKRLGNPGYSGDPIEVISETYHKESGTGHLIDASKVAVGSKHSCAIAGGGVYCWGDNNFKQSGSEQTTSDVALAHLVTGATLGTTDLAVGDNHACALVNGYVYCWGDNSSGQVGQAAGGSYATAQLVNIGGAALGVAAGGSHSCAIGENGNIKCWGNNSSGQLGNNSISSTHVPQTVLNSDAATNFTGGVKVSAGSQHTCAIREGSAYCWGQEANGKLGSSPANSRVASKTLVFQTASGIANGGVTDISTGDEHTCVVTNGVFNCFGLNSSGQVGKGDYTTASGPYLVR